MKGFFWSDTARAATAPRVMNLAYHFRELPRTGRASRGCDADRARRRSPTRAAAGVAVLLLASCLCIPSAAQAGAENESAMAQFSWGLGSGLCTLVYTPLKVAYAATAIPIGGLVWIWSVGDTDAAGRLIGGALSGDFVVTPDHLKRERSLSFRGDWGRAEDG
jgi:hypothetical protein